MRRYPFQHMQNVRDLGGYPLTLKTCTKFGVFIRSDAPVKVTEDEAKFLLEKKINTVIDLRSEQELEDKPCAFSKLDGFCYHSIPLWLGSILPRDADSVSALYFDMADEKNTVARVIATIASAPDGVLFHCTAGKDRTGIIASLILSICGVSMTDIVADYQVTYTYISDMIKKIAVDYPDAMAWLGRSNPEFIEGFYARLFEKYGSARGYLLQAGIREDELNKIKSKLVGLDEA